MNTNKYVPVNPLKGIRWYIRINGQVSKIGHIDVPSVITSSLELSDVWRSVIVVSSDKLVMKWAQLIDYMTVLEIYIRLLSF